MAAVTYFCGADAVTNPFMNGGFTTNAAGADPCGAIAADTYMKAVLNKTATCGTTWQSRLNSATGVHADHAWDTSFAGATTVTGTSLDINLRSASATFTFYLVAYDANGGVSQVSTGVDQVITTDANTPYFVTMTAASVTVPAGGYVGLRSEQRVGFPARIYWGTATGGKLIVDEVAAVADVDITCVAGSMSYTGQVPSVTTTPAPRTVSATLHDSTGTFIPNGVNVIAFLASEFAGAYGSMTPLGNAATSGGDGSVSITVYTAANVILVADMLSASVPTGEVVMTDEITPVL